MARRGPAAQSRATARPGYWLVLVAAMLGMLAAQWPAASSGRAEEASLGGPFELVDYNGVTRTAEDFRGSYPLIYFGFTHCPDLCPTSLTTMSRALEDLAERAPAKAAQVALLFITVDPERDTVEVMKDYVANFHPRLVGLTGSAGQIDQVTRNYGAFYAPVPTGGPEYLMDHSGFILLMGPAGEYLTHFESDVDAVQLAEELERRIED